MKIHSDVIAYTQTIRNAARTAGPGTYSDVSPAGSRTRAHAFTVHLSSDGTPDLDGTPRRHRAAGGQPIGGTDRPWAASYADWGRFLAAVFAVDPHAVAGPYRGADDFARQTRGAFPLPAVTA